jgi:hypothetical protein
VSRRGIVVGLAVALSAAGTLVATGLAAPANAQLSGPLAVLQGTFQMSGRVTVAVNVQGERAGQVVTRSWTFTPECATAPCSTVKLERGRATGIDALTLQFTPEGIYTGAGLFYAPLLCSGRVYPRGQEIPFRITVRVTARTDGVASAIDATYVNRERTNLTPCIGVLGHDAARYTGQPVAG